MIIHSIDEYFTEVKTIYISDDAIESPKIFFRGEANEEWNHEASLFRGKIGEKTELADVNWTLEKTMIESALVHYPDAFMDCPNALSRLVKMQHFGLPTRLYDVTSNPLVALFFACSSEKEKNGIVMYTKPSIQLTNISDVNILADLAELLDESEKSVKDLFNYLKVYNRIPPEASENSMKAFLFKSITKSFLFQPPMDNERIRLQQGAFIFSAIMQPGYSNERNRYEELRNTLKPEAEPSEELLDFCFTKNKSLPLDELFESEHFIIQAKNKRKLLRELDLFGINEGTIFPELEHKLRAIKTQHIPRSSFTLDC